LSDLKYLYTPDDNYKFSGRIDMTVRFRNEEENKFGYNVIIPQNYTILFKFIF
jgi:hypothetical protein